MILETVYWIYLFILVGGLPVIGASTLYTIIRSHRARSLDYVVFFLCLMGSIVAGILTTLSQTDATAQSRVYTGLMFNLFIPLTMLNFLLRASAIRVRGLLLFNMGALAVILAMLWVLVTEPTAYLSRMQISRTGMFTSVRGELAAGDYYWVTLTLDSFLYACIGGILLFRMMSSYVLHRRQAAVLLAGWLVVFTLFGLTGFRVIPDHYPNTVLLAYVVLGLTLVVAQQLFPFFEMAPVSHNMVFNSAEDPMLLVDSRQRIIEVNPAASEQLAIHPAQVIYQPLGSIQLFEDATLFDEEILYLADKKRYFSVRVSNIKTGEQKRGQLISLRDITELKKQREQHYEKLIADLEDYNHTVAHDLKEPLLAVRRYLEIMEMDSGIESEYARRAGTLLDNMVTGIEELLMLSAVRHPQPVQRHMLDMTALVYHVIETLEVQIESAGAIVKIEGTLPPAPGYAPWIIEVWANYLSNAIKYGGNPPFITISGERRDSAVCYRVVDNGRALEPETYDQLFTAYRRFTDRATPGHGLGLSIVKRIMERSGGDAGARPVPGGGSCFYFTLPLEKMGEDTPV